MERNEKRRGLNGAQLKWIAFGTMVADHAAVMLVEEANTLYWPMRLIGRLAFPLYCFLLAEGFCHTRSAGRYLGRLAVLAVISEIPFNLLNSGTITDPAHQNVMFTLFLGLLALWGSVRFYNRGQTPWAVLWCACMAALAWVFQTDYGWAGVVLIVVLYWFRANRGLRAFAGYMTLMLGVNPAEITALFSFALIEAYNGERGGGRWQQLFYLSYPLHILVLWGISLLL